MKTTRPQVDYSAVANGFQLVMPLNCEINIGKNVPVRLLNTVMERIGCSKLYATYSGLGRIEYSPKILMKIMVYGYMRKQISSCALEACCRENLHLSTGPRLKQMRTSTASYGKSDCQKRRQAAQEDLRGTSVKAERSRNPLSCSGKKSPSGI